MPLRVKDSSFAVWTNHHTGKKDKNESLKRSKATLILELSKALGMRKIAHHIAGVENYADCCRGFEAKIVRKRPCQARSKKLRSRDIQFRGECDPPAADFTILLKRPNGFTDAS